jgi:hypothetical protein
LEEKIFLECLKHYQEDFKLGETWNTLSAKYNFGTAEVLRQAFKNERRKRGIPGKLISNDGVHYKQSEEYNEKTGYVTSDKLIEICATDSKNPISVLEAHGFDANKWEVVSYKNNLWHSQRPDDAGLNIMYQSKITVKPKKQEWSEDTVKKLFDGLEGKNFEKLTYKPNYVKNGKMFLYPVADLHLGLLSTVKTSGNDYNIEIAKELCDKTTEKVLGRLEKEQYEKIELILGNDFLNTDNLINTTTKGTPQDSDLFWYEMTDAAIELIIKTINALLPYAPVNVHHVYSNHDEQTMYGVMRAVEFYFKDDANVSFDISILPRTYFKFGKNIIGLSHDIPVKKALELFTTEAKKDWSEAEHMYWLLAHMHTAMNYEKQGYLEIYRLPTISGWSRWTTKNGYAQTEKKTQCFVFDEVFGITDVINIVVS